MMLKEGQLTETLFIISCSASKNSRAEGDKRWVDVIRLEKYSRFQEFASIREELLNFYSSIHSDVEAQKIYQGFKYQSPLRWRKAWQTNSGYIFHECTGQAEITPQKIDKFRFDVLKLADLFKKKLEKLIKELKVSK